MAERLRVWGIADRVDGKNVRRIVATANKAEAARAFSLSRRQLDQWGGETKNEGEFNLARAYPGAVFFRLWDEGDDTYEIEPGRSIIDPKRAKKAQEWEE